MEKDTEIKPHLLKGDLDNIILMALRKEPERRYSSVEDLNQDIDRYLTGLPISARPNTFFYRASKFYNRNKTASIVGLLLILSLVVGIIATTWQTYVARQERDRAQKRFNDVRQLSNSLLFEITPKIENLEGSTEAREILVRRALEYLDSLSSESQTDLNLQSELASAYEKVGDVQGKPGKANLGDLQGGINSYEKAQKIRLSLVEKDPQSLENQRFLALNYNSLGDFRWWASDLQGASSDYEKTIGILEKLVLQKPDDISLKIDLLNSILNRIKIISYNGNYEESIKQYQEIIRQVEVLETKFPDQYELKRIKAHCLIRAGYDLSWQNRYDILGDYVKKSFAIYEPLITANPNDARLRRDLHFAYFQAGGIYVEDNPPLALQYLEKSVIIAKGTVENDKLNFQAKHDLAQSYSKIGEVLRVEKKYAGAVDYLNKASVILNEIATADPRHEGYRFSLANNYARLAAAQEGQKDFQNAIKNYQNCIEAQEKLYQRDSQNNMPIRAIAIAAQDMGNVYEELKLKPQALEAYRKSVEMFTLLEQKGGVGEYDRKNFETSQKAVERLGKR